MLAFSMLRQCALFAGAFTILGVNVSLAGNPWDSEPTDIPEVAYETPAANAYGRNPKNRFGVQGGVAWGVKAEFITNAFTGNNITVIQDVGPENVGVNPSRDSTTNEKGEGGEIFYERVLGESDLLSEGVNETWGVHFGVGFNHLGTEGRSRGNTFRQLPGDAPVSTEPEFPDQGIIFHDLEADLWHASVGLFKESYLTDNFYTKVGGGLTVAYVESEYSVKGPFDFADETASDNDFLFGGYLDLTIGYDVTPNWSLYGGIRYQYLSSYELNTPSSDTKVEFNQSYMAFVGVRFAF